MVAILTEPTYIESMWGKTIYLSLTDNLRKKRISFCEIIDTIPKNIDTVFIIASDYEWIKDTVLNLNSCGYKPILLGNQTEPIAGCSYSCVCSDIIGSVKYILNNLNSDKKLRVALYGVNTNSLTDISRIEKFFEQKSQNLDLIKIFLNNGSLANCYKDFFKEADNFDAVICSNDLSAVSLIRHLEADGAFNIIKNLKILSYSQSNLSKLYGNKIISVNMNLKQFGKAAVFIYEKLKSCPYISNMTINILLNDIPQENVHSDFDFIDFKKNENHDIIYDDPELSEMIAAEKILETDSLMDKTILAELIKGKAVSEISAVCFLTESGVKYRIKKMLKKYKLNNKNELISVIKNYLPNYNFTKDL